MYLKWTLKKVNSEPQSVMFYHQFVQQNLPTALNNFETDMKSLMPSVLFPSVFKGHFGIKNNISLCYCQN